MNSGRQVDGRPIVTDRGYPADTGIATQPTSPGRRVVGDSDPILADTRGIHLGKTLVLVGCGSKKRDPDDPVDLHQAAVLPGEPVHKHGEPGPAWEGRDLYTSTYVQLKSEFADTVNAWQQSVTGLPCGWAISSAEHGILQPGESVTPYDTSISDPTVETDHCTGLVSGNGRRPDGPDVVTELDYWAHTVAIDLDAWTVGHHDDLRNDPRQHQFTHS